MTHWLPKLKGRDESKPDSYILMLGDEEKNVQLTQLPLHSHESTIWFSAIAHLEIPQLANTWLRPSLSTCFFVGSDPEDPILLETLPSLAFCDLIVVSLAGSSR